MTLILGGARSGKSARALMVAGEAAQRRGVRPVYLATAPRIEGDAEWAARIARHRAERGEHWRIVEVEIDL
ncbi:MAG: bifunctional adenosylcobinamide kinase/adenosylcobinamide-phosphate guanylyltransferase, partial [Mariprofundaceae bacterium]